MTDDSKTVAPDREDRDLETPTDTASTTGTDADAVRRERDEYQDLLLRKTAELDNYRKRVERERTALRDAAAADLLAELLSLVDDLERALAVDRESARVDAYREGVELIRKQLLDLLDKRGVSPIPAVGQPFDPNLHQAVAVEASDDHEDGTIIEELRRGYTLRGRLLRAAMVRVAQA